MGLIGRVLGIAVSVVTLPLIARHLGTSGFGVWSAGLAYVGVFAVVTEFGLTGAATLRMAAEPEREAQWLAALASLRTLFGLVLTGLCLLGIPLVLDAGGDLRTVALILSVTVLTTGTSSLLAVFLSRVRGAIPLAIGALRSVTWLGVVLAVTLAGGGVRALAAGFVGMSILVAIAEVVAVRRRAGVGRGGSRALWRPLLAVALPVGLGGLFVTVSYRLDTVLLYSLRGAHEAGVYGAAYRFLDPLVLLPTAIMGALVPVLSAHRDHDPARVRRLVQLALDAMAALSLPALALGVALAGPGIAWLLGPGYVRSAHVLPILMGAFVALCYGILAGSLAPLLGLQWRLAGVALAGTAVNVALNLALIGRYGAPGSAWITVGTEALTAGTMLALGLRALGLRPAGGRMARIAVAAALTGVAAAGACAAAGGGDGGLAAGLAAGAAAYAGALLVLRVVDRDELRALKPSTTLEKGSDPS